jgi:hypothetical protein
MSRNEYPGAARAALDRFDTPPLSAGFADRIVAAAVASGAAMPPLGSRAAPRRDRRGVWRRVGQGAIGVAAFGMMSAAAVASGLLGAVGIEVPVLSAMLAPAPVKPKPMPQNKPVVRLAKKPSAPPAIVEAPAPAPAIDPALPPWKQAMMARREENRARRNAFIDAHPGMREAIAAGPEARRAYLAEHPDVKAAVRARFAEARARRESMRAARIQRQRERTGDVAARPVLAPLDPAMRAAMAERRQARLEQFRALDPEARTARIEAFRIRREARRAMRAARAAESEVSGEGFVPPAR